MTREGKSNGSFSGNFLYEQILSQRTHPLISIVTVVLNDLEGLKMTAASIHSQAFQDFEWIIIDGGSTDGTLQFLAHLDQSTIKWISENDGGIYDAMNKAIKLCSGQYVVFINARDTLSSNAVLQEIHDFLLANDNQVDILFGGSTLVLPNNQKVYRMPYSIENYIWHGLPAIHQATYYSLKLLAKTKYDIKYKICGDYYIVAKLYKQGVRARYINLSLADFRVGGSSYHKLYELTFEPYGIQRDILQLNIYIRLKSLIKRVISTIGLRMYSNSLLGPFLIKYGWGKRRLSRS